MRVTMATKRSLRPVKWAHLHEIDRRTRVGTPTWFRRHTVPQQKLSAYRYLHKLGSHPIVREQARLRKRNPSSSMTVRQMISASKALKPR